MNISRICLFSFRSARLPGSAGATGPGAMLWCWLLLACLAVVAPAQAQVQTRAWLDRDAASLGESVTLNIETAQSGAAPDYRPLQADFELGQPYRSSNGGDRTLFGIALTPRREGALEIPALQIGGQRTLPLKLAVSAAAAPQAQAPHGDVFVESRVDDPAPYVQQSVGLTLRLYYATSLLSGELLQEAPDGASLQRIGDDVQSSHEVDGRRYRVVERRYLLVPERSGPLDLPPARFSGQGAGGFFDDLFGSGRKLAAQAAPLVLQVRAQPDAAPQPWLPLRSLRLRYLAAPTEGRVGEAMEIAVEAVAQGATAAQFPEIPVPRVAGAQVFPERVETSERFVDGGLQLTAVRRYSVVPLQPGSLHVPGPRMDWWDTGAGSAQIAELPGLDLQAMAAVDPAGSTAIVPPADADLPASATVPADAGIEAAPGVHAGSRPWAWLALGFAALWLATLAWLWWSRGRGGRAARATSASSGVTRERPGLADLRRALDAGSLEDVAGLLQRMADPSAVDLDEVIARLQDPGQRDALSAMRRALWAGQGDPSAARAGMRAAFREGPRWRAPAAAEATLLPPLYPQR